MVSNYQEHVREHSGRLFSKHELYHLPADEEEFNRLGGQHRALTMTMGLFYDVSDLVKSILSTGSETPLAVVDIGTGSGHWALELATEFPHVSVLGVDIVPPNPKCEVPSNCSFEIYDVNLPLGKYSDKFNLCHLRSVAAGIKDNEAFLYRIPQVLKPNGVLLLASGDIRLYAEDETPFPVDVDEDHPQWCASQAIIWESYKMKRRHDDPEEMKYRWERLLAENPFIESCGGGDTYIPIGPWKNDLDDQSRYAAKLMQMNLLRFLEALRDMISTSGFDEAKLQRWATIAKEEVIQMKPRMFSRWRKAWGVRNSIAWVPKVA